MGLRGGVDVDLQSSRATSRGADDGGGKTPGAGGGKRFNFNNSKKATGTIRNVNCNSRIRRFCWVLCRSGLSLFAGGEERLIAMCGCTLFLIRVRVCGF